jgi:hypothetical protein
MTTTRDDDLPARFTDDPEIQVDDPVRAKVLLAVAFVCLGQIAATILPILGSIVVLVAIALAASCLGWLIGGVIDSAMNRMRFCVRCRSRMSSIDYSTDGSEPDDPVRRSCSKP